MIRDNRNDHSWKPICSFKACYHDASGYVWIDDLGLFFSTCGRHTESAILAHLSYVKAQSFKSCQELQNDNMGWVEEKLKLLENSNNSNKSNKRIDNMKTHGWKIDRIGSGCGGR